MGATLCHDCGKIINTGHTEDYFCKDCFNLRHKVEEAIRTTLVVINKISIPRLVDKIAKEIHKNYDKRRE
jgi:hypothetical protein